MILFLYSEHIPASSQVSDFPEEQLLVAVFPGVPTAAELFLLPDKNQSVVKKKREEELTKVWQILVEGTWQIVSIKRFHSVPTGVWHNCECTEPELGGVWAQAWCPGDCIQHTVNVR